MPNQQPAETGVRPSAAITLRTGQRVRLEWLDREEEPGVSSSIIEEVKDDMVYVLAPMLRLRAVSVPLGARVRVGLRLEAGYYTFTTEVWEQVYHPQALLGLRLPDEMERRDQRAYYRLPLTIQPEAAAVVDAEGQRIREVRATVVNLSGGGLEMVVPEPLRAGDQVSMQLRLDDLPVSIMMRVRSVEDPGGGRFNYRAHCQFIDPPRGLRERIIRFVYREQVRRRQRDADRPSGQP